MIVILIVILVTVILIVIIVVVIVMIITIMIVLGIETVYGLVIKTGCGYPSLPKRGRTCEGELGTNSAHAIAGVLWGASILLVVCWRAA